MLSWLAGKMIGRNMAAIRAGDLGPTLALDADDVKFAFPGDSSFAPGASNKREHEEWLARFVEIGLQIYPDEVVVKGFPWKQTVCVRGHIHLDDPTDGRVYDNRYVLWGPDRLGEAARLRGLRGHPEEQAARRLVRAA